MRPAAIRLFATDLDGTLLGHPEAAARFHTTWDSLDPRQRPLLVYNTGRSVGDTQALVASRRLPEPDCIIGSVGTDLHDTRYGYGTEFRAQFGRGWDLARIEEILRTIADVRRQPTEFLHAFKSSWFWPHATHNQLAALETRLRDAGLATTVHYSCRYFLDVVPASAGKGPALAWLCRRLSIPLAEVLVAGDSGNDNSMFLLPQVRGILVENALPELFSVTTERNVFCARRPMADGVLEGLAHFGVLREPSAPNADRAPASASLPPR